MFWGRLDFNLILSYWHYNPLSFFYTLTHKHSYTHTLGSEKNPTHVFCIFRTSVVWSVGWLCVSAFILNTALVRTTHMLWVLKIFLHSNGNLNDLKNSWSYSLQTHEHRDVSPHTHRLSNDVSSASKKFGTMGHMVRGRCKTKCRCGFL